MDAKRVIERFLEPTTSYLGKADHLYQPHTPWPKLKQNFIQLPDYYSFDLNRLKQQVATIRQKHEFKPIRVFNDGQSKARSRYRGLGFTHRPGSQNPYYDALQWFETDGNYAASSVVMSSNLESDLSQLASPRKYRDFTQTNDLFSGYLKEVVDRFQSPKTKIRLAELLPGGFHSPHYDFPYYDTARIHAVLETNSDTWWEIEGERFQMPADGHFYFCDSGKIHSIWNAGNTPRLVLTIHLNLYHSTNGQQIRDPKQSLNELFLKRLA